MKAAIPNPVMYARIAYNSVKKLWNRSLVFRLLTLPVVILSALLLSYALRKPNYNHDLRNSKPTA